MPSNSNTVIGSGEFRLTGTRILYRLDVSAVPAGGFVSTGSVNTVSGGAFVFPLDGLFCSADRGCGFFGETNITEAQASLLRTGGAQVVVDGIYRGRIVLNALCQSPPATSIPLEATLRGRVSLQNRTNVVWGKVSFVLSGHLLRYRIDLPALAGQYFGSLDEPTIFDPLGGAPLAGGREVFVGTLDCGPTATNLPPASGGFDGLPRCVQEGSICLRDDVLASLLAGQWDISFYQNFAGQYSAGQILPADTDGDGVPDYLDACPNTAPGEIINAGGCSIEQLAPRDGPWRNHGEFVNRVKQVTADFLRAGLITEGQRRILFNQAAQSGCGK